MHRIGYRIVSFQSSHERISLAANLFLSRSKVHTLVFATSPISAMTFRVMEHATLKSKRIELGVGIIKCSSRRAVHQRVSLLPLYTKTFAHDSRQARKSNFTEGKIEYRLKSKKLFVQQQLTNRFYAIDNYVSDRIFRVPICLALLSAIHM